jgi:hypothetical protein
MTKTKLLICPYCGQTQSNAERCRSCGGLFEPLSRQATHNAMGPWFLRDPGKPFHPGCSYETLVKMIDRGQITRYSILRGPTTKQFWTVARHVPGVAHLLGYCHNCDASVDSGDHGCHVCGAPFGAYLDRNYLGLPDLRPLPWDADAEGDGGPNPVAGMPGRDPGPRISGFATDDELLGPPRVQAEAHVRSPEVEFEDESSAASFFEEHASPVMTSMRRKLEGQHRTIRTLMIVLVAVIVISAIAMLSLAQRTGTPGPGAVAPPPETRAGPATETQPPVARDQPATPPVEAAPAVVRTEPEVMPVVDPVVAAYTRAQQLIAAAGREDRPAEERMGDLQQALDELKSVAAAASDDNRPADLDETTAQVERELERLRLDQEFFGEDDA